MTRVTYKLQAYRCDLCLETTDMVAETGKIPLPQGWERRQIPGMKGQHHDYCPACLERERQLLQRTIKAQEE